MHELRPAARGAALAVVLAFVLAAPAAAAQPTRTVTQGLPGFILPAGSACAFDVAGRPSRGFIARTGFSDGRVLLSVRAHGEYVNLETGSRYPTADNYRDLSTTGADGIITGTETGETTWYFLPGEVGPFGIVQAPGALYHFVGSVWYTYDTVAGRATSFTFVGTVRDFCRLLS